MIDLTLSPTRLVAVLFKEFIQMKRDRITFAMMLGVPIMQLLLFGFAINSDPKRLPTAILDMDGGHYARAITTALETSGYFRFDFRPASLAEGEHLIASGQAVFLVTIPSDLGARVDRGDAPEILIDADATDPAAASGAVGALSTVAQNALTREKGEAAEMDAQKEKALSILVHRRYNPEGVSQYNIVPGLLGVILQMTMVMMTAMGLTRETERGTMENLLAMPATPMEIMLGKVLPFLGVGAVQVIVVLVAAKVLFAVPFVGSMTLLLSTVLTFVLSLVLMGYFISTFAATQMQAMQLTFFFFLPSLMLSGFMFPFSGMPGWAQTIGEWFPLTHFLRIVRGVMLKGADLPAIAWEWAMLLVFIVLYAGIALTRFRRTLD
ncbi:MAG: ABC transporter permease [Phyllobacteriaceae bacterium]|nr:ABC transporter permease [Phyllobacteriaceae bacterium]